MLLVPPENGWLDAVLLRQRREGARASASQPARSLRRFALLLYQDRSRPRGGFELALREEMSTLAPELFERTMERIRTLEKNGARSLRW